MIRQELRTSTLPFASGPLAITMIMAMAAAGGSALAGTRPPPGAPGQSVGRLAAANVGGAIAGTWRLLPVAPVRKPLAARASVWTGRQLIIHGDYPSVTFSYQPSTNKWKRLRPGPTASTIEATDVAVWTGSRMLVMGLTNGSYNPATNTWRPIARPILPDEAAVVAWTGHQAIIWGGVCCDGTSNQGEAYNLATNTWRPLPGAPLQARRNAAGGWTAKELIVVGGTVRDQRTFRDGAAYNPGTNHWRWLGAMSHPRRGFGAVWTGHRLLVWGGLTAGGVPPPHGSGSLLVHGWMTLNGITSVLPPGPAASTDRWASSGWSG
jgi:hypothetical protein